MSHKRSRSGTETRFAALSIGMPENISAAKSTSDRWETRTTDLHIEEVQGSLVIYDGRDDSVHYLTDESRRKPRRLGRGKPVVGGRKVSVVAVSVGLL